MHESRTGIRIHQHFDTNLYLLIILAGECLHHDTHRPYHIITNVRTSDTFTGFTFKKVRVAATPHKAACILIDRIVYVHITQIRHSKKAGYIGIVH